MLETYVDLVICEVGDSDGRHQIEIAGIMDVGREGGGKPNEPTTSPRRRVRGPTLANVISSNASISFSGQAACDNGHCGSGRNSREVIFYNIEQKGFLASGAV